MYRSIAVKSLVIIGLTLPFAASAQTPAGTTNNSGTVAPIAMPGPPVLTPPNVSLPGSGPATRQAPSMDVNNAARGGSGSVYQPSPGSLAGSELPATPGSVVVTGAGANETANTATKTVNAGLGTFVESSSSDSDSSLADVARRYKAQHAATHSRTFDNNNVRHADYGTEETNSAALPQSDQPAVYGSTAAPGANGVLDQRDYAAVQAAIARSQSQTNANNSDDTVARTMPDPNRIASTNEGQGSALPQNDQATEPQAETEAAAAPAKRLPQSASPLPFIFLVGLIVIAAGGFTYRLQRTKA